MNFYILFVIFEGESHREENFLYFLTINYLILTFLFYLNKISFTLTFLFLTPIVYKFLFLKICLISESSSIIIVHILFSSFAFLLLYIAQYLVGI